MNEVNYKLSTDRTWRWQEGRIDLTHALLGISSEVGEIGTALKKHFGYGKEIDMTNIKEELGDLLFYIARVEIYFDWHQDEVTPEHVPNSETRLTWIEKYKLLLTHADRISELLITEDHTLEVAGARISHPSLRGLKGVIECICEDLDTNVAELRNANIEKLKVRFPEKFDIKMVDEENRDREAEAAAIKEDL